MLRKRLATAFGLLPLPIFAAWFGEPWFTALVGTLGVVAVLEFYRLGSSDRLTASSYLGAGLVLLLIVSRNADVVEALERWFDPSVLPPALLGAAMALALVAALAFRRKTRGLMTWAVAIAGVLYVGWLLGHWVALRAVADGRNWVFLGFLATSASDTAAFFTGRAIGKHRLAPGISPGKTWEGAAGGLAGAVAICLVFVAPTLFGIRNALFIQGLSPWQAAGAGVLVSVFGALGDLAESRLKRNAGVKDASSLLPGHGGVLDRLDSVLFTGVATYYFVLWFAGA